MKLRPIVFAGVITGVMAGAVGWSQSQPSVAATAASDRPTGQVPFALRRAEALLAADDIDGASAAFAEAMAAQLSLELEPRALALAGQIAEKKARKGETALKRAEALAAAEDLDGAASALTEAFGANLNNSDRALALAREIALKKVRKATVALQRAEALVAEGDLDGAGSALAEVFAANVGNDAKAVALAREIAAKKARQETSDEKKALFEAWLKRGQMASAERAASESQALALRPTKRATEIEKLRVTKEAERNIADENLRAAEDLLDAHDYPAAEKRLEDLTKAELTDAQRIKLAELTKRTIPRDAASWLSRFFTRDFWTSVIRIVGVTVGIGALCFLAWIARRMWGHRRPVLGPIEDTSERGIGNLVLGTLAREKPTPSQVSAGYFSIHTSIIPVARIKDPVSIPSPPEIPLEAFDGVTGNLASSLSKFFLALPRWWRADAPTWSAKAFKVGTETAVILTYRKSATNIVSLECSCPADVSFAQLYSFVEDVVFTMYYLIENPGFDRNVAGVAPNLRFAVDQLELYSQAKGREHLEKALGILQGAQKRAPLSFDAKLFEGITLDILNRHEEAISQFQELKASNSYVSIYFEHNREAILLYNEAIAHLRCYTKESLEKAEMLINECIDKTKPADLAHSTAVAENLLHHMARAALANIIAHKVILWADFVGDDKVKAKPQVSKWVKNVTDIVASLKTLNLSSTNDHGRRQLQWAIANAEGNVHLNYANNFLSRPKLDPTDEREYQDYLEKARLAFHQAEGKLTPLVETLTNLATVYLYQKDFKACRNYCDAAIKISPDYEYAFYRKAQSYDAQNDAANARKAIEATPKITIPSYRKLVKKYSP